MIKSPKLKKSVQRRAAYAKGGDTHMFGKQAAGPDRPGNTGKDQSAAPGVARALGGPRLSWLFAGNARRTWAHGTTAKGA